MLAITTFQLAACIVFLVACGLTLRAAVTA
jgi:outer membrane lipopolysaccharide assembly protein LptE/RlpB